MQGKRMTLFIGAADTWHRQPLELAVLERIRKLGLLGATVTHGIAGFGGRGHIKTVDPERGTDLPVVITVVDAADRVEQLVAEIMPMLAGGVLTVEDVDIRFFAGLFRDGFPDRLVREVMSAEPAATTAETPLAEVVKTLLAHDYTALPVVDAGRRVIGIVDESDLVASGLTEMSRGATASSVMKEAVTVAQDRPLREAAHLMHARRLKRIPVVDDGGRLVGMLGRLDLLRSLASAHAHPVARPAPDLPPQHRTAGDVMDREVPAVTEDAGILEVLELLLDSPLKRVVVVDDARHPIGIITDTDLVARVDPDDRPGLLMILRSRWNDAAREKVRHARGHRAADLMSKPVVTVPHTTPVAEALAATVTRHMKRLPVVDDEGRLVGMVSRTALLAAALD